MLTGRRCSATRCSPTRSVWAIYVVGFLLSIAQSLQRPSREALIPRTVRHDELSAAVAVSSLGMQIGTLLGPALGGLLVGTVGVPWAYGVDIAGLVIATLLFAGDAPLPADRHQHAAEPGGHRRGHPLRGRPQGPARHLRHRHGRDVHGDADRAVPGVRRRTCFDQPKTLGLLYTAESVGTLVATLTSGWTTRFHHHGRAVVVASMCWGGAIALCRPRAQRVDRAAVPRRSPAPPT